MAGEASTAAPPSAAEEGAREEHAGPTTAGTDASAAQSAAGADTSPRGRGVKKPKRRKGAADGGAGAPASALSLAGPLWTGPLHDEAALRKIVRGSPFLLCSCPPSAAPSCTSWPNGFVTLRSLFSHSMRHSEVPVGVCALLELCVCFVLPLALLDVAASGSVRRPARSLCLCASHQHRPLCATQAALAQEWGWASAPAYEAGTEGAGEQPKRTLGELLVRFLPGGVNTG